MDLAAFVEALPRPSLDRVYDAPEACLAVLRGLPPLARAYVMRLLAVGGGHDEDDKFAGGVHRTSSSTTPTPPVTFVPLDVVASWPLPSDAAAQAKHSAAISKLERLAVVVKKKDEEGDGGLALTPAFRRHVASAVALGGAGVVSSSSSISISVSSAAFSPSSVASATPSHEQRDAFADDAWDGLLLFIGGHEPRAPARPLALRRLMGGSGGGGGGAAAFYSPSAAAIDFGALLLAEGFVAPRRRRGRGTMQGQQGGGSNEVEEVVGVAVAEEEEESDEEEDSDDEDLSPVKPTPKGLSFLLSPTVAQLWELLRCVAAASSAAAESGNNRGEGGGGGGESSSSSPSSREDALAAVVALLLKLAAGGGRGPPLAAASLAPAALEAALDASALGLLMPFFVSAGESGGGGGAAAVKGRATKKAKTGAAAAAGEEPDLSQLWFAPTRLADALRGSGDSINKALSSNSATAAAAATTTKPSAAAAPADAAPYLLSLPPTATSATSSDAHVVVETNFRVYAYTTSPSRRVILSLFATIERVLPNLVVAAVTRSSCLAALDRGITAEQIVSHLREHASPRVAHRVPVVPENVADQIRLWEASRRRLRVVRRATLYSDFSSAREFEAAVRAAVAAGAMLWVERGGGSGGGGGVGGGGSNAAADNNNTNNENRHGRLAAAVEAHEAIKEAIRAARGVYN